MLTKVLPFSALIAQGRWKVEFFTSDGHGGKSKAFCFVQLKELFTERRGTLDPQQFPGHLFNYLGLEHVQSRTGEIADGYAPREGKTVLSRSKVFYQGDILYGRLRPSLNKVFLAEAGVSEGICSGEFYVLTPDTSRILPHFSRAILASRYVQEVVTSMTTGSALPRLALDDLLEIEVPLPSLDVQQQYEMALIRQKKRRQGLATGLRESESNDLEVFFNALEEGRSLSFPKTSGCPQPLFPPIKLPEIAVISTRSRGRPSQKKDALLF